MSQLVVKNLNKEFGEGDSLVHALSDVNLSVKTGEFLLLWEQAAVEKQLC